MERMSKDEKEACFSLYQRMNLAINESKLNVELQFSVITSMIGLMLSQLLRSQVCTKTEALEIIDNMKAIIQGKIEDHEH